MEDQNKFSRQKKWRDMNREKYRENHRRYVQRKRLQEKLDDLKTAGQGRSAAAKVIRQKLKALEDQAGAIQRDVSSNETPSNRTPQARPKKKK